jgi:hypothetical protein
MDQVRNKDVHVGYRIVYLRGCKMSGERFVLVPHNKHIQIWVSPQ